MRSFNFVKGQNTEYLSNEEQQSIIQLNIEKWKKWWNSLESLEMIPLWDNGAPNFNENFKQYQPRIGFLIHKDEKKRGMVIVCAGGAYTMKATYEGLPVAEYFFKAGFNTAVLDYRVKPYSQFDALSDARRAIQYIRMNADCLNTFSDKIAILGFSAGANLAGMAGTNYTDGDLEVEDPIERVSSRPDAVIQGYGSFSFAAFPTDILGYNREKQLEKIMCSPDLLITPDTPPFFLWQTCGQDDPRSICNLAMQLSNYGIMFEMHVYPYGPHGMGLSDGSSPVAPADPHVAHWTEQCVEWLKLQNF